MKKPKGFNKMTLQEQEQWLVKNHQHLTKLLDENYRLLAVVRGGTKLNIDTEISRPDESQMKD